MRGLWIGLGVAGVCMTTLLVGCGGTASDQSSNGVATASGAGGSVSSAASGGTTGTSAAANGGSSGSSMGSTGGSQGSTGGAAGSGTTAGTGAGTSSMGGGAGAALGGSGGSSTSTSSSTSGVSHGEAQRCQRIADCVLFEDCCTCAAVSAGSQPAMCRAACAESACSAAGITEADLGCAAGRCVLQRSCDDSEVECDADLECPAGELPVVEDSCYSGQCLPASQCQDVASCDVCQRVGLACVTVQVGLEPSYHCVVLPEQCSATDCQCGDVCSDGFTCGPGPGLSCTCPTC